MKETLRILRGDILMFIASQYPSRVSRKAAIAGYFQYYKPEDIGKALAYLCDSGFLRRESFPDPLREYEAMDFYTATPDGIDLMEGTAHSDGVVIIKEAT